MKITLPSPSTMQFWFGPLSGAYKSPSGVLHDLALGVSSGDRGPRHHGRLDSRLDESRAGDARATRQHASVVAAEGRRPEQLVDDYVAAIAGDAVRDAPVERRRPRCTCVVATTRATGWRAAAIEPVAEKVFGGAGVDLLFLEFDSERSGDFAPLRHVPVDTTVVSSAWCKLEDTGARASR